MTFLRRFLLCTSFVVVAVSALGMSGARADDQIPLIRLGVESKNIKSGNQFANLIGVTYNHYESDRFTVGGAVYTGQLSNGATGSESYGGLLVSWYTPFRSVIWYVSLLVGGGGAFIQPTTANAVVTAGAGLVLEPTIGVDFGVGKRVRAVINAGYNWLPSSSTFSGFSFTLGIHFID